jgi:hypothetical protein
VHITLFEPYIPTGHTIRQLHTIGKETLSKPRTGGTKLIDGLTCSMMLGLRLKEFSLVDTMSKCGLRRLMSST